MTAPTAPDVADWLCTLARDTARLDVRDRRELAQGMVEDCPPGLLDQYRAAAEHTVAALTENMPSARSYRVDEVPDAVLVSILHELMQWGAGRQRTCIHRPDPARPQPVLAAAWKPGVVVCPACTHLLRLPRGSVKDRTCDLCGHVAAGPPTDPVLPVAAAYGPFVYLYGCCRGCWGPS